MPYKQKTIEKKYFSIGEVAYMFKVAPSLIRFWEKEFDQLKPVKNKKGNRQFTKNDIEVFTTIYDLVKTQGYTLQGAKEHLKMAKKKHSSKPEELNQHKDDINILEKLKELKHFLEELSTQL